MSDVKRKWDVLSEEKKKACVDQIITILDKSESNGIIVAGQVIDVVAEQFGPTVYNKALEDVRKLVAQKLEDLEVDIDILRQS